MANFNTNGYKGKRFEIYMNENGRLDGSIRTDTSNGPIYNTKRPLDIAINGPGYIPVTKKDGKLAFTRDGSLAVNAEGMLVTTDGAIVGDGIKIPPVYQKIKIEKDGTVIINTKDLEEKIVGKIPLVTFNNPEGLKCIENNMLLATEESGKPIMLTEHTNIKQGSLERSNVSVYSSVNDVLRINGSLISSVKLIKVIDEFYRQSVNLRQ